MQVGKEWSHRRGQTHDTLEPVGTQFLEPPFPHCRPPPHLPRPTYFAEGFSWADDWLEKNAPPPARLPVREGQVKVSSPAAPTAGPGCSWGPKADEGAWRWGLCFLGPEAGLGSLPLLLPSHLSAVPRHTHWGQCRGGSRAGARALLSLPAGLLRARGAPSWCVTVSKLALQLPFRTL